MNYPLYDRLCSIPEIEPDIEYICSIIGKFDRQQSSIIYSLILHHFYSRPENAKKITIPFSGRLLQSGKGVIYQLESLPTELIQIIAKYLNEILN